MTTPVDPAVPMAAAELVRDNNTNELREDGTAAPVLIPEAAVTMVDPLQVVNKPIFTTASYHHDDSLPMHSKQTHSKRISRIVVIFGVVFLFVLLAVGIGVAVGLGTRSKDDNDDTDSLQGNTTMTGRPRFNNSFVYEGYPSRGNSSFMYDAEIIWRVNKNALTTLPLYKRTSWLPCFFFSQQQKKTNSFFERKVSKIVTALWIHLRILFSVNAPWSLLT